MMKRSTILFSVLIIAFAFTAGCGKRQLTKSELDRVGAIEAKIAKAEEMDARECAPKDLAYAKATLDHAKHELSEHWEEGKKELVHAEKLADDLLAKTKVCWEMKQKKSPPTVSITANPPTIEEGGCSSLSWTTTEATSAKIDRGVGSVETSGGKEVCPSATSTYTITVSGPGGETSASTTVTVAAPKPPVAVSFEHIYFDFDKSFIRDDAKPVLEKLASYMKGHKNVRIQIEGHCDERGTNEYNFALGERRAQAAKNYLTDLGVDGTRIKTISYGEERPADPGHNESAWAKNRRDVFVIEE